MLERSYLSESAIDRLQGLDVTPEVVDAIGKFLDQAADMYDLKEGELDIYALHPESKYCFLETHGIEIGEFDIGGKEAFYCKLNDDPRTIGLVNLDRDVKDSEIGIQSNELYKEAVEIVKEEIKEDVSKEPEVTEKESAKAEKEVNQKAQESNSDKSNKKPEAEKEDFISGKDQKIDVSDKQHVPLWLKKEQLKTKMLEKQLEKKDAPSAFDRRREAKDNYKEKKAEVAKAYGNLRNELTIAKANGYKDAVSFNQMYDAVRKKVDIAIDAKEVIPSLRQTTIDTIKERSQSVAEKVNRSFDKIKAALTIKIESGIRAIKKSAEKVMEANGKFITHGKTAYAHLSEDLSKQLRDFNQIDLAMNTVIENTYKSIYQTAEKVFERTGNVKEAFKNVGRSIVGKEMKENPGIYSDREIAVLAKIREQIDKSVDYNNRMAEKIEKSADKSIEKMTKLQETRESKGLGKSDRIDDKIKEAKERSAQARDVKHDKDPHIKSAGSVQKER